VAGCYTVTSPVKSRNLFIDLFQQQVNRFIDSGYWLDDILEYMLGYELVSSQVYSKENGINKKMLREGWERCFGNTRLLVLAHAISPPDFLHYIMSPHGITWATNVLSDKWDSIMSKATEIRKNRCGSLGRRRCDSLEVGKQVIPWRNIASTSARRGNGIQSF